MLSFRVYIPPEETQMTRAVRAFSSCGLSSRVNRKGPTTFVAKVDSSPSEVCTRSSGRMPALWTKTSMGSDPRRSTACRTESRSERSMISTETRVVPVRSRISAAALAPRFEFRQSRTNSFRRGGGKWTRPRTAPDPGLWMGEDGYASTTRRTPRSDSSGKAVLTNRKTRSSTR